MEEEERRRRLEENNPRSRFNNFDDFGDNPFNDPRNPFAADNDIDVHWGRNPLSHNDEIRPRMRIEEDIPNDQFDFNMNNYSSNANTLEIRREMNEEERKLEDLIEKLDQNFQVKDRYTDEDIINAIKAANYDENEALKKLLSKDYAHI